MISLDIISVIVLYSDHDTVCSLTKPLKTRHKIRFLDFVLQRDYRLKTSDIPENICFAPFVASTQRPQYDTVPKENPWKTLLKISNPLIRKTQIFCTIVERIVSRDIFCDVYSNGDNLVLLRFVIAKMIATCPIFHTAFMFVNMVAPPESRENFSVRELLDYEGKLDACDKEKKCLNITEAFDLNRWWSADHRADDSKYRKMYPAFEAFEGSYHDCEHVMLCSLGEDVLYIAGTTWSTCATPMGRILFMFRLNTESNYSLCGSDTQPMRSTIEKCFFDGFLYYNQTNRNFNYYSQDRFSEILEFRTEIQKALSGKIRNLAMKLNKRLTSLTFEQRRKLEKYLDCLVPKYDQNSKSYQFSPGREVKCCSPRVVVALQRVLRRCVNCFVLQKLVKSDWMLGHEKTLYGKIQLAMVKYQRQANLSAHSGEPRSWPVYMTVDAMNELKRIERFVVDAVKVFIESYLD